MMNVSKRPLSLQSFFFNGKCTAFIELFSSPTAAFIHSQTFIQHVLFFMPTSFKLSAPINCLITLSRFNTLKNTFPIQPFTYGASHDISTLYCVCGVCFFFLFAIAHQWTCLGLWGSSVSCSRTLLHEEELRIQPLTFHSPYHLSHGHHQKG